MSDKPRIRVTQIRGTAGTLQNQRQSLLGLGLKRRHQTRELEDTPAVRGMIRVVKHLVRVEPVE